MTNKKVYSIVCTTGEQDSFSHIAQTFVGETRANMYFNALNAAIYYEKQKELLELDDKAPYIEDHIFAYYIVENEMSGS